jgi:Protein of unknown function (DUF4236)
MRFSKRLKFGPVNVNLSGKGIGASVGIPGARIGVDTEDRKYSSLGIPGTGLSQRTYHGALSQGGASTAPSGVGGIRVCNCGTQVAGYARFCTGCGRWISTGAGKLIAVCLLALLVLGALVSIIGQIGRL